MTRGPPLRYAVVALCIFVGGVGVLAAREHLPAQLVRVLAPAILVVVAVLVALAWRKRRGSRDVPL